VVKEGAVPNPNISPVGAGSDLRILKHKRTMVFYGHNEKVQFVPEPEPTGEMFGLKGQGADMIFRSIATVTASRRLPVPSFW